jgi:hypothetical protein
MPHAAIGNMIVVSLHFAHDFARGIENTPYSTQLCVPGDLFGKSIVYKHL